MKKKNNVIVVTECPYSGVLRAIIEDAKIIKDLGYTITFVLPKQCRDRYGENSNKNISLLEEFGTIDYIHLRRKIRYLIADTWGMKKYLGLKRDYLLFSYSGYAGKINRILYFFDKGKKVVHVPQCIDFIRRQGRHKIIDIILERILSRQVMSYLACGSSEMDTLINTYHVPREKVHLNPNSIPQNNKNKPTSKSIFRYEYVIAGRVVKDKGVDILLSTLKSLNLLDKTIVIGDGVFLEDMRAVYKEATFTGNIPNDKVFEYLSDAKYVLSASIIEGLPFSILEAMSFGVVPIISNVKGHKDIITHGITGFLFSNETELYDLLFQSQLWSQDIYQRISENARDTVQSLYKLKQNNIKHFLSIYG